MFNAESEELVYRFIMCYLFIPSYLRFMAFVLLEISSVHYNPWCIIAQNANWCNRLETELVTFSTDMDTRNQN